MPAPMAYLLTWTTYGSWLQGDERGSVVGERRHGAPYQQHTPRLAVTNTNRLKHDPIVLDGAAGDATADCIRSVCRHRDWTLLAMNVRSNHVHVVVSTDKPPEKVMADIKAWATRGLREPQPGELDGRVWTKHGSTRYLFDRGSVARAVDSVLNRQ